MTVASSLSRRAVPHGLDISIVEPSPTHYYQPAFTLVGAGAYTIQKTRRETHSLIPKHVNWIADQVMGFDPDSNQLELRSGEKILYDYLVICPGLNLDWEKIDGAKESLGSNGVCSNYSPDHAEYTWSCIRGLEPGANALFTQPPLPFKCPGAPQKIVYLAADHLKKRQILNDCTVRFLTHGAALFAVPLFAKELEKVAARYDIDVCFQHNLVSIDGENRQATFEIVRGDNPVEKVTMDFDMLHVTPPQSPPTEIKNSPLANEQGWIELDQYSLQHVKYENVFGLGDAGSTPNSKTAAAVRKQSPVVVKNLLAHLKGQSLSERYDGYASCPLTTAYGKVLMAEFCYGGKVTPTFPLDPRKERWSYWWIKASGLPMFYWNYMLKGHERFLRHDTGFEE